MRDDHGASGVVGVDRTAANRNRFPLADDTAIQIHGSSDGTDAGESA